MATEKSPEERIRAYNRVIPGMTDSHFHSEVMAERGVPLEETFQVLRAGGAAWIIDISITPGTVARRRRLCAGYGAVRFASGIHPGSVGTHSLPELLALMDEELSLEAVVAAGEMGLDWVKMYAPEREQREAFLEQLRLANRHKKPVIIHNRGADEDIYEILRQEPPEGGGIMHCFSSGRESAETALDLGLHISFAGNVSYKRGSEAIQEACAFVPENRLLLETDAPFLAPQAVRGRPNTPAYVGHTYDFVAELRGTTSQQLAAATGRNLETLLGL